MDFKEFLKNNVVCLDGAMGAMLQGYGLAPGDLPERWNITRPEVITAVHRAYYDAGSNVVSANTFGANSLKFDDAELEQIVKCAIENARRAGKESVSKKEKFVALDIGPTGKLLKPLGDLDFEDALKVFAKTVKLGVKYGADLIVIETMNDAYETKAALLAAKENSTLPVIVTNAYGKSGRLMTGATPSAMVALLEGMGADAVGVNCSLGPAQLRGVISEILDRASVPVVLKPNAGLPQTVGGKTFYDVTPSDFANEVASLVREGVRVVGGCCGTSPEYIECVSKAVEGIAPVCVKAKDFTVVSSYNHALDITKDTVTGVIKELDDATGDALDMQDDGVEIITLSIDDEKLLCDTIREIQTVCSLPLAIETENLSALEAALRIYNGKALIKCSSEGAAALAEKYGAVIDKYKYI